MVFAYHNPSARLIASLTESVKRTQTVFGHLNYWRSFRIKISHRDTYTRNHYIWRHLLCIYLFTNLMYTITIFNVLRVSLTDSVRYVLIHISLFSFCCCNLLLLLTMSGLKCSNFSGNILRQFWFMGPCFKSYLFFII